MWMVLALHYFKSGWLGEVYEFSLLYWSLQRNWKLFNRYEWWLEFKILHVLLRRCLVRRRMFFVNMCFILEAGVGREISCVFCPVPRRQWRWLIKHQIKSFSGSRLKWSSFKLLVVYFLRQLMYLYHISIYWPCDQTLHSRNKRKLPPSLMEKRNKENMVSGTLILSEWSFAFVLFFTK